MPTATHSSRFATRRGSTTLHVVTGVTGWYSGMALTTECGVKRADVLEEVAAKDKLPATVCKRCIRTLGWDL